VVLFGISFSEAVSIWPHPLYYAQTCEPVIRGPTICS